MRNSALVSIVIPTKNSAQFLENCLKSIKNQSYKNIEIIIVDGDSNDGTVEIGKKYKAKMFNFVPRVRPGTFDAPYKMNFGAKNAKGEYIFYVDVDMEISKNVVKEAVDLASCCYDAVIIKEDSFGKGIWAKAKNLERRCYWGDDVVEAPRFFKKAVWDKLRGLDEDLGGGGDDWDLYQKFLKSGYKVARIKALIKHNEGDLKLMRLIRKRFMYGRDSLKYISKRPVEGARSYFPIRAAYFRNWRIFVNRPKDTVLFIIMRSVEYFAGFAGILYSIVKKE
jgi:glycosyltransferase involved in cell wall biosynthesis